jgi:hypothetical protein
VTKSNKTGEDERINKRTKRKRAFTTPYSSLNSRRNQTRNLFGSYPEKICDLFKKNKSAGKEEKLN